jgi:phosphatidylglycerol:prolipoprotein diacylglycerol transferase
LTPVIPDPLAFQSPYRWFLLAGLGLGALGWRRMAQRGLALIYLTGLLGAFLGAKFAFLFAEGWQYWRLPVPWLALLTGKSVLGALPGGYAGVEFAKWRLGYHERTGDWFAAFAPAGILLGRVGCLFQGCCLGVRCARPAWWTLNDVHGIPRWPAVPVEMLFNACAIALFWVMRRKRWLPGQHFHLYLMGYAAFRFFHEFLRDTPRFLEPDQALSGYQILAIGVFAFGAWAFYQRATSEISLPAEPSPPVHS